MNKSKQQETNRKRTQRGTHPNSRANLERGRNKHGAPRKGLAWKELIKQIGDEIAEGDETRGMTWKEKVVRAAFEHACKGNAAMLRELMQRSDPLAEEVNVNVREMEQVRKQRIEKAKVALAALERVNAGRAADAP